MDVSYIFHKIWQTFVQENTDEETIKKRGKYELTNKNATLLIEEGSARSTKTHSILQFLDIIAHFKITGLKISIARDTLKNCKDTVLEDFLDILTERNIQYKHNKSEAIIIIKKNHYKFIGLDDPHKGHGAEQDILYVNEIMGVKEESFKQKMIRTSLFTIIDYNPSEDNHYIYNYKKRKTAIFHKTSLFKEVQGFYETYEGLHVYDYDEETDTSIVLQHPFAPPNQVEELYLTRPCAKHDDQKTTSEWHWQVYGLGNKCAKEGLIFNNWSIIDDYDSIVGEEVYYGLDFGVVHPTALVEVKRIDKSIYIREIIYSSRIKIDPIIEEIKANVPVYDFINADCAGLVQIEEIFAAGINIHSCVKKKDFKNAKIKQLQGYKIYIDSNSKNIQSEIGSWMWRKDRAGNTLPEPVKIHDDAMDAIIYACEHMHDTELQGGYKVTTV